MRSKICMITLLVAMAAGAWAQQPPLSLPTMSGPRALVVGPIDSVQSARPVSGKLRAVAMLPKDTQPAVVEIFVDETSYGKSEKHPYFVEIDMNAIAAGEHAVRAVARDKDGKELWAATTKIRTGDKAMETTPPTAPKAATLNNVAPPTLSHTPKPAIERTPEIATKSTALGSLALDKTFASAKYGLAVNYPACWTTRDETANLAPKLRGGCWIVLGAEPIVVNIHTQKLAPGTGVEEFAKFNSYVQKWQKTSIEGKSAFVTSTGNGTKRVVHRIIMIGGNTAWMLNCVDTSGQPAERTESLLKEIAASIHTVQSAQPERVKINKIKVTPRKK